MADQIPDRFIENGPEVLAPEFLAIYSDLQSEEERLNFRRSLLFGLAIRELSTVAEDSHASIEKVSGLTEITRRLIGELGLNNVLELKEKNSAVDEACKNLASKIDELLASTGLSLRKSAELTGFSHTTVNLARKGLAPYETTRQIAERLGVGLDSENLQNP